MKLIDLFFPPTCPGCGKVLEDGEAMCQKCASEARRNPAPHCAYCGVSLKDCNCTKHARPYDRIVAPFYYEGSVRETILRMKFGKKEEGARFLADELKKEIEARYFGEHFDLITVVPMSRARYAERGFNQARTIAELLMKEPPAPLKDAVADYGLLQKSGSGEMQHLLGAEGRRQNIRGSVRAGKNRELEGKRVLLVDDIVTTGATAGECAAILRLHGAARVCIAAAAVTRPKSSLREPLYIAPENGYNYNIINKQG